MWLKRLMIACLCVTVMGFSTILMACNSNNNVDDNESKTQNQSVNENNIDDEENTDDTANISKFDISVDYKEKQLDVNYDNASATKINLSENSILVEGSNVTVDDTTATITSAGTYIISGTILDGQIVVDSQVQGYVWIVLNNANITNQSSSAIYVKNAENTLITLPQGTKNKITDGKDYVYAEEDTELNAAIYSKDDLFINGTGNLIVNANYNHGIQSKDDLVILSGNINIQSVGDAIIGKDSVVIKEAKIVIDSGADGIKATNAIQDKGYIYLDNPTITIEAQNVGIQAETCMVIVNGTYDITTGGGSQNASVKENGEFNNDWGNWGGGRPEMGGKMQPQSNNGNAEDETTTTSETAAATSNSAKGIKAEVDITIQGGTFTFDTSDDTIHTNNSITINDGNMMISSGDDGIHSDTLLTINGGDIEIIKSYEGIESSSIYINSGNLVLTASDDGFNAAGGNDLSSVNGRPGQNPFSGSDEYTLTFNGGTIQVDAAGDGLDSNGTVIVNGGTIYVDGPTNGGNSAVDYGTGFEINGGLIFTAGSTGMAVAPLGGSQYSVMVNLDTSYQGDTEMTVQDSLGNIVLRYTPGKVFQSIIFSSEQLKNGETYTIYADEVQCTTVTISSIVTTSGNQGGMNGGMQGGGGGRDRGF